MPRRLLTCQNNNPSGLVKTELLLLFRFCQRMSSDQMILLALLLLLSLSITAVDCFTISTSPILPTSSKRIYRGDQGSDYRSPIQPDVENYNFWEDSLSVVNFNMDLQNVALEDPRKAQDCIEIMEQLFREKSDNNFTLQPNTACYNTVIDGYIQNRQLDNARLLLEKMERRTDQRGNGPNAPSETTYSLVVQAYADDAKDDFTGAKAQIAEGIMRRMLKRGMKPSVKMWSIVMEGWCKRAGIVKSAMRRAEDLLDEMEMADGSNTTQTLKPNVLTYTSFIGGLARSKENNLARKAEATLDRMRKFGVEPDVVAYTSVLNCWSKAASRKEREVAASRALKIIGEMERLYAREMYHTKPSLITYATAIRAIGNSLDPGAPKLAEDMIRRMYNLYESKTIANLKPTTMIYNAVLNALSRAPFDQRLRCANRAEQILGEMHYRADKGEKDVQPDVRTWAAVLRAWSTCGQPDAAENAERVLQKMEWMYREGKSPVRPNYVCFTTVMGAWGQSRRKDGLDRMEKLLIKMEKGYEEYQEADIRPNTVSYVTAIDAFVRRNEPNAAQRAQDTVDRMMRLYAKGLGHVRPTRIIFNTLIHAWSKSKEPDAAEKAEQIFKWMEAQYKAGDELVRPDQISLCAVLNAWANQAENGGAERAQQIYEHMQTLSLEERGFHISVTMPNIVIKALARSGDRKAVEKAENLLNNLESDFESGQGMLRPDVTTYSSVINCCAYYRYPEDKEKALQTALVTFEKVRQLPDETPNNIVYGTLFKAIANLMPETVERDDLVRSFFDQCCDDGAVDAFVLSQIRLASPELYRDLVQEPCGLGGPGYDDRIASVIKNIPSEWSANVVEQH